MKRIESCRKLGARLKSLRKSRGLSLEVLAPAVGMSPRGLAFVEAAHKRISADRLWRIAQYLDVSMDLFFYESQADIRKVDQAQNMI